MSLDAEGRAMRVLHVIPSLSPKHGGPSLALPAMARGLSLRGVQVDVVTTDDDGPGCRLIGPQSGAPVDHEGFRVFYFPKQTEFYKVSLPLLCWLFQRVEDYDVVHVHAVFSFTTLAAGWACRMRGVPYVVRPLGVLNTWGMQNRRRLIKTWSFRLVDKPVLDHAAAIHFTSDDEAQDAARLELKSRPVVLPLGIDLAQYCQLPERAQWEARFPQIAGRSVLLFLSRLHPKKGIEVLLEAMARLDPAPGGPFLLIAGEGENGYAVSLRARVTALHLEHSVLWAGHVEGVDKLAAFAAADVFVLPSYSENFGIALVEAMAAGLPCVTTTGVAVSRDLLAGEGGLVVEAGSAAALAQALRQLLEDPPLRTRLGANATSVASERFSLKFMGESLQKLYGAIINEESTQ